MSNIKNYSYIYKLSIFILAVASVCPFSTVSANKNNLQLTEISEVKPLKKEQGYLLINLNTNGIAASVEIVKLLGSKEDYFEGKQNISKSYQKISLELKNKSKDFYVLPMSQGLYQITKVNVPYFDLPYILNTDDKRKWRFYIEKNKTNYVGELYINKERSTTSIDVSLYNRIATDLIKIKSNLSDLLPLAPLVSGAGVRDDFFDFLTDTKGENIE